MTHPNPDMIRQGYTFLGIHDRPRSTLTIDLERQVDGSYAQTQGPASEEQRDIQATLDFQTRFGDTHFDIRAERIPKESGSPQRYAVYGKQPTYVFIPYPEKGEPRHFNKHNGLTDLLARLYTDLHRTMEEKINYKRK